MRVINFILFQLAWFACVLGAAKAMPWAGVGVTFIILCWHFYRAKQAKAEITLMLAALFIGAVFDQSMLTLQLIEYQAHGWSSWLVPVWILALWLAFASTLNVSTPRNDSSADSRAAACSSRRTRSFPTS